MLTYNFRFKVFYIYFYIQDPVFKTISFILSLEAQKGSSRNSIVCQHKTGLWLNTSEKTGYSRANQKVVFVSKSVMSEREMPRSIMYSIITL